MAATSPDQEHKRERRRSRKKDGGEPPSRKKMKRKRKRSHHRHKRRRREKSPSSSSEEEEEDGYSSSTSNCSISSSSSSSSSDSTRSSTSSRRGRRHRSSKRGDDRKNNSRRQEENNTPLPPRHRSRSHRIKRSDSREHHHHDRRRRRRKATRGGNSERRSNNYSDDKSQHQNSGRRKRKHRSSSSASSKDDTTGHFKGGRGTFVGDHYRIVRDVGLGTFGRVVQCEYVNKDDRHNRVSDSRSASKHRSSSRDRRDNGHGRNGNDKHQSNNSNKHNNNNDNNNTVAIKIVRNVRRYYESALIEGDICERVNREQSRQNKEFCARMIDRFSLPRTGHYCLVFECLGMSLYDFLKRHSYRPFPMYCVQDFARQMLEAVDFLHEFHLIHTDLKPENVLLSRNEEVPHRLWNGKLQRVPVSTKVKIIDFGGATYNDEKKSSIINTRQYRAPEVILGWGWSYPSDLWSVGCIIAELYRGELLFATHDNAEHLALMERAVGPFPRECLDKSTNSLTRECFDTRGWHKIGAVLSPRSIEHVRKMAPVEMLVDERDRGSGLGQLLRSLLTIDPKRRATAREALRSPFFAHRIGS
mmetsp:Transcript_12338/g.18949  ORF Transcript_12338/g.18949 Transcript_12338/m.18949 type:complete len:586 (-) Transcript_12338:120-1877(-)|eukprot:CAMPEP_0201733056 /NCGR_PEP_ID=MMETSP0593-20130828/30538_1 /ASSEMBLY_ACC=CAM_ASM_000672 /TAXON_ID=267983 /ORGANISM="Skeletonema japonicum, Strain CCMP2506" /LENGTH=585 /DNA_ID=CAMNT_0048226141 /DNA_START=62 /DNA_END=1819 /DNA_ORIENTATION=-